MELAVRSIEEIPIPYRSIFNEYPCFNAVQSKVLDDILHTDHSVVISSPTGSGKTVIFELAIVRLLTQCENLNVSQDLKIVYISPIKSLCQERLVDWHRKFSPFGLNCASFTGDSDNVDFQQLTNHNLIISTPEKWDSLTRKWRDNQRIVKVVKLFLIDEVHLLNEENRGSTLEVIVSRMKTVEKTIVFSANDGDVYNQKIRFLALSATVPNVEDIAEWLGKPPQIKYHRFSEEMRPVKLKKIVLGYSYNPKTMSPFKFDLTLNYKLQSLIMQHSEGKPTLIFCSTRKSVEMTANHIVQTLRIHLNEEQRQKLTAVADLLTDSKAKATIKHGIGYHHAGMIADTRHAIENLFRRGDLPVLVTTSSLAMGVNLPAHLVIVKSTKCYDTGGFRDYTETAIHQMIGRAGRPQFDVSATALILTTNEDKTKFEKMVGCGQPIESNLHRHLIEHVNAEVVLRTITDLDVAMQWLASTFLYVRARKNPRHYGLNTGLNKDQIDKKLLEICQIDLNKLVKAGMLTMDENIIITPTKTGEIMAKFYVAFETMKLFTQISGTEIMIQILDLISRCQEFSEIRLRVNDKKTLNLLNKNSKKNTIRFPINGKIKTWNMKVNCIIQAVLGNLEISDHSILGDCYIIMRNGQRIAKCLVEYLEIRKLNCYNALYNTIILCKCLHARLWENSPYISKQLSGIGSVMSHQLANAGKTTFQQILDSNPRSLEMIIKRKNPMGNTLIDEVRRLPIYEMVLEEINKGKELKLSVTLINVGDLVEKPTVNINSTMTLMVGNNLNEILIYEKYRHAYMIQNPTVEKSIELRPEYTEIHAHFISNDWVGIDCSSTVLFQDTDTSNRKETSKEKIKEKKGSTYIQMFLDMYMKSKKKVTKNEKSKSKVSNHDKREEIEVKEDSEQRISKKFSEDSREEQRGATLNGFVEDEKTKIPPKKIGQMKRSVEPEERKGSIEISNDVMDIAEYSVEDPAIEICDGAETKNEDVTSELVEIPKETAQQKDYYETEDYEEEENAGGINAESVLTADEDVMMVESDAAPLEPVGTKATEESNQIGYQNECTDTVSNASTSSLFSNGLSTSVFAEHASKVHDQAMEEMKSVQSDREGADEEKPFFIASQEKQEVPRNVGRAGTDEKPKYASLDFDEKLAKYPSIFRMTQSYITDEYATDDRDVKAETSKNNNKRRKNDFHLAVKVMDSKEDAKKRQKLAEFKFPSKKKFSHRPNPQAPSDSTPDGKMYAITEIMEPGARRSPSESNDFETSSDAEVRDERRAENAHRSITWRSPLVFSPPVKFSPKMGFRRGSLGVDRDDGQNANINETLETSVSSKGTSNLTINIQRTPKSRRTNTTTLGRSPTMSFPLCDREYNQARASNNDKSEDTSKNDPLDICSNSFLEKMGLPRNNQSKTTPRSAGRSSGVSDYYSQFLYQPIRSQKQPNTKQEKEDVPSESVSQRAPSRGGDKEIEPQKRATDRHRLEPSRQTADEPRGQSPRDFILAQNRPLWYRPRSQRPDNLNRTLDEFTEPVQNFRVDEFATFGYPYNFDSGYPQNPASHVSSRSARPSRLNETITSGSYEASCNCLQPHCHLAAKNICGRACAEADNFRPRPLNTNNFRLDESISFPNEQPLYYLDAQPNYGFPKREMCDDYLNRTMRAEWYPEEGYLRERQNLPRRANYQDRFVDEANTVHPPYYRPIPRRIDEQNLPSTSQRFAQQPLRNYPAPDNGMPNREVVARGQNFEEPLDDGVVGRLTRSLSFEENPGLTSERLQQQEMNDRICRMQRHDTFVGRNVGFPQEWGDRNRHGLCYGPSQDFYNENLPPSGWGYPQEFHGNRDYVFPSSNDKEYVMNKFFYSLSQD